MNQRPSNRILHIPRRFVAEEWGGTESVVLALSQEQQRAGGCPEIFTTLALARRARETIGGIPVRRFAYSYPCFGLSDRDRAALDKKGGNLLSWGLFLALLRARDVRLFHAHTLNRLGATVRTAARMRRKPYVVTVHGGYFDLPPAQYADLCQPLQGKWEWGRAWGALLGSRRVLPDADLVLCVGAAEFAAAREKLPHDRIAHLPNGVDPDRFAQGDGVGYRQRHALPADALVIACVSRLDAQKNQLLLVQAFARLRQRRPHSYLLLIGPVTQPEYAARLTACAREIGLGDHLRLLPGLRPDDPDLVRAYHACDVFALPSRHEPFGIVVLEAWSSGRPVVASRVGGLSGLLRHEITGLLFDPEGPQAAAELAHQLERLAGDASLRAHLAAAGWEEARSRYAWPIIARQLETLYAQAEDHARSRRRALPVPSGSLPDQRGASTRRP
jgi:glycosyltransferase involved in cell wall biosynthesis